MPKLPLLASITMLTMLASCNQKKNTDTIIGYGANYKVFRSDLRQYTFIGTITKHPVSELRVVGYMKNNKIIYPRKITYVDIFSEDRYSEIRKAISDCKESGLYGTFVTKRTVIHFPNGEYPDHSSFEVKSISRSRDPRKFDICR